MVSAQSGNATDEQYIKAMNAMEGYSAFCSHAVAQRQAEPTDDLMSVLVHAEVDGDRLSPDDVLHESLLILVGGDETTRHVISGGVEQLLVHPDQRQLLVDDPSKITVAVEEMLRWVTPIKNMCRTVTVDTEFMGQPMIAGQKCMLLFESANRDSTRFEDPFRFDVERNPERAPRLRVRRALLPRSGAGPPRAAGDVRTAAGAAPRPRARGRPCRPAPPPSELHQRARIDAGAVQPEPSAAEEHRMNTRELVEKLWVDLYNRDFDAVGAAFADDGEYTDMPTPADDVARGPAQIAARLRLGLEPLSGISPRRSGHRRRRRHRRHRTRRALGMAHRREGVAAVRVDARGPRPKLVRWWDYWDLATLMNSAPAWWVEHIMNESARIGLRDA